MRIITDKNIDQLSSMNAFNKIDKFEDFDDLDKESIIGPQPIGPEIPEDIPDTSVQSAIDLDAKSLEKTIAENIRHIEDGKMPFPIYNITKGY
jgi:hypothetical protein